MILGEDSEIVYPNKFMMRSSDGNWVSAIILRCSPGVNAVSTEIIGTTITGASSGATAVVSGALSTAEAGEAIVEFELNPDSIVGTFTDGETITGTSTVQDVSMTFTVRGIVTTFNVSNDGILYDVGDTVNLDTQSAIGNGEATAEVISVKRGSISDVIIDDAGTKFDVGDALTFTTTETSTNTKDATGFVSVIDGSLIIDGTDSSASDAGKLLVIESGTITQLEDFQIVLDGGGTEASAVVNGATTSSTTVTLDGNSGTIVVGMTVSGNGIERARGITVTAVASQTSITISTALSLTDNINLFFDNVADGVGDNLVLDGIDSSSTHAGSNIILNQNGYDLPESLDTYGTETDSFALEEGTVGTGEITRIFLSDGDTVFSNKLSFTITSVGFSKKIISRNKAQLNDDIYVTGNLGESSVGLKILKKKLVVNKTLKKYFENKYFLPTLNLKLTDKLSSFANTSIDISDGLISDLEKLINKQKLSYKVYLEDIPVSNNVKKLIFKKKLNKISLITEGDDYQILFTAKPSKARIINKTANSMGIKISNIGKICSNLQKSQIIDQKGKKIALKTKGYLHKF